jgi:precorrin-6B methylase 2
MSHETETQLRNLIYGFSGSQCLFVAAKLDIADHLKDTTRNTAELAALTNADSSALERFLRALVTIGILHEDTQGSFGLTPLGNYFRGDIEGSLKSEILNMLQPSSWETWGQLLYSVQTGRPAFPEVHGTDVWAYRAEHPAADDAFKNMAGGMSRKESDAILKQLDLSKAKHLMDVGGGQGALLTQILTKYPNLNGILFDLPHAISGAEKFLKDAEVADRCVIYPGDFFDEIPKGCDVYLLKAILHNWSDEAAVAILKNCSQAMSRNSRIVLIERLVETTSTNKFLDLHMLVIHGGKERTAEEYRRLLENSGFRLKDIQTTDAGISLIEGTPV